MPISIECPACDESFAVADSGAGKKVACPRCGNINRIPGMKSKGEPAGKKAAEQNSQLNVAKRLSDDEPATPAAPPRQPPQVKPPVAPSQDDLFIVSDDDSKPSAKRESETSSPPSERRRKRKKTPSAVLWGTIALGGIAVISLALYTSHLEKKKLQKGVAKRKPAANTTMNSDAQTEPGQQPVRANDQEKVDQPSPNEEPFAPFENEKEPNDPLVNSFRDAEKPVPTEPEDRSSTGQFTPDAVKSLFQQCQDLQWKPETLSDYAKLQGLAKLITDCGRAGENETFDADQKEAMLKAAGEVMETLSTTRWGDQLQITSINKLAIEGLQNGQELGIFAYATVYEQTTRKSGDSVVFVVFFKLLGTDQHVAIPVKKNSDQLTPGSRWLILGEVNFLRTTRLTDGNTGNVIVGPEVTTYHVIEEPK